MAFATPVRGDEGRLAGEVDAMVQELLRDADARRRLPSVRGRVLFDGLAWQSGPGGRAGTSVLGLRLDSAVSRALARRGLTPDPPSLRTRGLPGAILKGAFTVVGQSARAVLSLVDVQSGQVLAEAKRTLQPTSLLDLGMNQLLPPGAEDARLLAQLVQGAVGTGPQAFALAVRTVRGAHAAYFDGERLEVMVETERDCHLRLYHISWSEKRLTLVFPNRSEPDGFVTAGATLRIPGESSGASFEVTKPYGVDAIVAIASETPFADEAAVRARLMADGMPDAAPGPEAVAGGESGPDAADGAAEGTADLQRAGDFLTEERIDEPRTRAVLTRGLVVRHREDGATGGATAAPLAMAGPGGGGRMARAVCYFTTLPRISLSR